jgi:hypothetical protein
VAVYHDLRLWLLMRTAWSWVFNGFADENGMRAGRSREPGLPVAVPHCAAAIIWGTFDHAQGLLALVLQLCSGIHRAVPQLQTLAGFTASWAAAERGSTTACMRTALHGIAPQQHGRLVRPALRWAMHALRCTPTWLGAVGSCKVRCIRVRCAAPCDLAGGLGYKVQRCSNTEMSDVLGTPGDVRSAMTLAVADTGQTGQCFVARVILGNLMQ